MAPKSKVMSMLHPNISQRPDPSIHEAVWTFEILEAGASASVDLSVEGSSDRALGSFISKPFVVSTTCDPYYLEETVSVD